jgi:hypothetical protein
VSVINLYAKAMEEHSKKIDRQNAPYWAIERAAMELKPVPGSVVYCDLHGVLEHSGIYVGRNAIVHLNGKGKVEKVTPEEFLGFDELDKDIYVSARKGKAAGCKEVAKLARSMVGTERNYNIILDNCHQFVAGCLTGEFNNANNFLILLKSLAEKELEADDWLVWMKYD